jgi:hypothetical protein
LNFGGIALETKQLERRLLQRWVVGKKENTDPWLASWAQADRVEPLYLPSALQRTPVAAMSDCPRNAMQTGTALYELRKKHSMVNTPSCLVVREELDEAR